MIIHWEQLQPYCAYNGLFKVLKNGQTIIVFMKQFFQQNFVVTTTIIILPLTTTTADEHTMAGGVKLNTHT